MSGKTVSTARVKSVFDGKSEDRGFSGKCEDKFCRPSLWHFGFVAGMPERGGGCRIPRETVSTVSV